MNETLFFKATVTGKNQITIPRDICQLLNIEKGNQVIFKKEDNKIIFELENNYQKCFSCNGTTQIEGKPCFVCNGTGKIETSVINDIYYFLVKLLNNSRKHNISFSLITDTLRESGEYIYKDYPTIKLRSEAYSSNELLRIQDEIQKLIIEQLSPRSIENKDLFCIPSDSALEMILDTLATDKAKEEVTKWFRYIKTI